MGHIAKIRAPLGQGNPAKRGVAPIIALIPRCNPINKSGFRSLLESPSLDPATRGAFRCREKGRVNMGDRPVAPTPNPYPA